MITIGLVIALFIFWGWGVRNARIRKRMEREAQAAREKEMAIRLDPAVIEAASPEVVGWLALREMLPMVTAEPRAAWVDGRAFLNVRALAEQFQFLKHPPARPSQALAPFKAVIETAAGKIEFLLGRDSENRRDYWVFYPRYTATRAHAIGLISTDLLDFIETAEAEATA
jgi:hypothetical protein